MKKFVLSIATLLFSILAIAQTPVAYYPFSGNTNDAIGTLNGTVNGGASLTTDRFGNSNSAYSFDGVDDAISFTAVPMTNIDNFTLMAWINPAFFDPANQFNKMIISLGPGNNGYNMGMGNNSGGGSGNQLGGLYNLVSWLQSGSFFSTINTWYHVAMVRESGVTKFYLNGVQAPNTFTATPNAFTTAFQIGGQDFDPTHYWNGKIDEVKIYDVALTALQIQREYASSSQLQKPGSGNAISFDGTTQSLSISNSSASNFGTGNFSAEFWMNSTGTSRDEILMSKRDDGCGDGQLWGIYKVPTGTVYFEMHNPGNVNQRISVPNVLDGKWHHLSFVRNGTQLLGYKDGVLVDNNSATPINVNNSAALTIGTGACAPFIPGGGLFEGKVDEFKIWNIALAQSEIRDRMCHKITASDPLYNNLVAYYNFDESAGTTVFDGTINSNHGTLANNPSRVTSGAAIGNASSHDYVNAIKTTTISHATGESFTVTSSSGNPDGIQVYRIDEQPNILTGATGVGNNDKYFGVFQVNGTTPQYTAVYNYSGNPGVNIGNEFQLRLNKRTDNAATTWSILPDVADEAANTITVTGQSTEYILGKLGFALPVSILSFSGTLKNQTVLLEWKVTDEINIAQFVVERSNGTAAFTIVGTKQPLNLGNTIYTISDNNPFANGALQYYRLKIIDKEGRFKYSNIIRVSNSVKASLSVFPNPVKDVLTISGLQQSGTIKIISADGKIMQQQTVTAQTITLDMSNYAKGIYLLQYAVNAEAMSQKIIKQ